MSTTTPTPTTLATSSTFALLGYYISGTSSKQKRTKYSLAQEEPAFRLTPIYASSINTVLWSGGGLHDF
jgi:hypothetical protein